MRGRMYRYTCNRGFRLFGPKTVHCSKTGWSLDNDPFCVFTSKGVCDRFELLGEGMKHGTFKALPKYKGGFYRFECEPGYIMSGNRTEKHCRPPGTTSDLTAAQKAECRGRC